MQLKTGSFSVDELNRSDNVQPKRPLPPTSLTNPSEEVVYLGAFFEMVKESMLKAWDSTHSQMRVKRARRSPVPLSDLTVLNKQITRENRLVRKTVQGLG